MRLRYFELTNNDALEIIKKAPNFSYLMTEHGHMFDGNLIAVNDYYKLYKI